DLQDELWTPVTQRRLQGAGVEQADIFDALNDGDILVHHPYDSFATSAEAFIDQAARDPDVLAIKQTLYRTSGPLRPIGRALIRAAGSGKQVVALVELKARGDEQANIAWAQALEQVGVHVVYGVVGLKTHAKVALVVRREGDGIRRYVHVGTGNYNPKTAQIYEDVGLLSADPDLGSDVAELFNFLTGYSRQRRFRRLLVAPVGLRSNIIRLIRKEAARPGGGRIILKVNSLVDPEIVEALYTASQAGTEIDLIVRGLCSLRPGVPGLSDRIRVRSLVGRFLDHSRIFRFGPEGAALEYYLGSSDLMPRNLDRRVEAMVPVIDRALQARMGQILEVELEDDVLAWALQPVGSWSKVPTVNGVNAQQAFEQLAEARAAPTNGDGPVLARRELEFQGDSSRPPDAAVALVIGYTRRSALVPVATLSTLRRRVQLKGRDGAVLAEVVDDDVSVIQGLRVQSRFREVEVELRDPAAERLLEPILARLRGAGAADGDQSSKLSRALGARAAAAPEVEPIQLNPDATAGDLLRHVIAVSVASLMRHDPGVRLGDDPEDVHRARVATRRLRSQLRTFRTMLDPAWANSLREDLRWLGTGLGSVRDKQVMSQRLRGRTPALAPEDAPMVAELADEPQTESEEARARLVLDMRAGRFLDLIERLVEIGRASCRERV